MKKCYQIFSAFNKFWTA